MMNKCTLIALILGMGLSLGGASGTRAPRWSHASPVTAPSEAWYSGGPFGGYVNSLAFSAADPEVVYAATVKGVYKSTNSGGLWVKTNHPNIEAYSVAVAGDNPQVVYSGTTAGVYQSCDGGASWLPYGLAALAVKSLAIDPRNANILFAGATDGIYKSDDAGENWVRKRVLGSYTYCTAILVDSDDSNYVYASVYSFGYMEDGLLKSENAGETFQNRHVASDVDNMEGVYALAMTPAGAATPTLYAFSVSFETDVYKSIDRGENWTHCNLPDDWWMVANPPVALAVDPTNPIRVYLGVGEYSGKFYSSPNAGATWQTKMSGLPEGKFANILVDPGNGYLLVGIRNGGIYRSSDAADSWGYASNGLINTDIVGLSIHPTNSMIGFATSRGRGHHLAKTTDQGLSWMVMPRITSGYIPTIQAELGAVAYDPQRPNTIFIGDGWQDVEDLYLYKSINGGDGWEKIKFMNGSPDYWDSHGVADIWVHPQNSNIVLLAVSGWGDNYSAGGIYRSYNGGYAWTRPLQTWASSLMADPNHPNIVYAGTRQCGYVYRSEDAGIGWTNISPSAPPGECWVTSVNDLEVDGDGSLFAATSGGLMQWDGQSWTQLTAAPEVSNALAIDRTTHPATLYLGTTSLGVFVSPDSGYNWTALAGLETVSISRLILTGSSDKILYARTKYGGVWVLALTASDGYKVFLPLAAKELSY